MKKKLMMVILAIIISVLLVVSLMFNFIFRKSNEENVKDYLRSNNDFIKNYLINNDYDYSKILTDNNFQGIPIRVTYISTEGNVVYDNRTDWEAMDSHDSREEFIKAKEHGVYEVIRESDTFNLSMLYVATTCPDGSVIRSSVKLNSLEFFQNEYLKYYLWLVLLASIIGLGASYKLAYYFTKPIQDLDLVTSQMAKGEFYRRANIVGTDEAGTLAKNFNLMANKLENTLKQSREEHNKLKAIIESIDSGIIAIDRDENIIMINPYALNLFHMTKEVIGENILKSEQCKMLSEMLKNDENNYEEIQLFNIDNKELRIKKADIINRNEHIGMVIVIQDITDIKRLENIRSRFVTNVTHELKTPLTSIKGFAETLKEVDDPKIREKFLDIINEEAERLTRLINDILLLSHLEQQGETSFGYIDANKIIRDVYYMIKVAAQEKSINIKITGDMLPDIYGDEDKFKQMIINLVDNAVKYSGEGSIVIVNKELMGDKVKITVEDNGIGIEEEHLSKLFERFYRVDKARSRNNGGTGLGLAIVKHIVKLFDGKIFVESKIGVGTKFTVILNVNSK
ncbi:two-component system, OmpR family, phosphate regulon sensor histidine kinase PhoR [Clostridium collagenovorans DSM 3089]|uniref:histidine kinase n=1 Tax=Clostridium collagenovorans DSM 3089 TaxID=1121306 RepID=A0A1M5SQZ7_9CLOT|nr:HAMP domain-containing sensor histidine kinase [Clostridium collagenovorans]SHH40748.1 two-component system, OmpR family, phosphate regulon sensor histidine kinase PhoR [Clostridium collagenovorans DSM 3089]